MRASMSSSSSSSTGTLGSCWAFSSNFPLSILVDSAGAPVDVGSAMGAEIAADKLCAGLADCRRELGAQYGARFAKILRV